MEYLLNHLNENFSLISYSFYFLEKHFEDKFNKLDSQINNIEKKIR